MISIQSSPSPARITTRPESGTFSTPASIELERKNSYTIVASSEGYRPAEFLIRKKMRAGILVLDVLFTGLLGVVVDAVTGGWWDLDPNNATMVLERANEAVDGPDEIELRIELDEENGHVRFESDVPGVTIEIRKH